MFLTRRVSLLNFDLIVITHLISELRRVKESLELPALLEHLTVEVRVPSALQRESSHCKIVEMPRRCTEERSKH